MNVSSILKACLVEVSSSNTQRLAAKRGRQQKGGVRQRPHTVEEATTALQDTLEEWTYNEPDRLAQAKAGMYVSVCLMC